MHYTQKKSLYTGSEWGTWGPPELLLQGSGPPTQASRYSYKSPPHPHNLLLPPWMYFLGAREGGWGQWQ
ncbi:hypothetical protein XELAEV_18023985mg [Xenopus laevis]|uniref:Uncharacterized protein n=1 Tax=Xenopus laevis TaxID=8355 RepID=A0A974D7Z9_XENLA|nr:hypothetical protein XELAEV_18023985mg [Xenopus laevis]